MPAKKEESYDCKVECAELKKEVAALKKEIAALKKELKAKPSGGADPRVDKIVEYLQKRTQERPEGVTRADYKEKLEKLIFSL